MDAVLQSFQHLDAVAYDEYLAVTFHLQFYRLAYDVLVVGRDHLRLDRIAVGWRRIDDAQVARAEQGELQRTRDRRGRQRQHIHVGAQALQFVLHGYAEFLLLVYNQQP